VFRNERQTRLHLQGHDVACPRCGYNLRGMKRLRCPECGREFSWQDMRAPEARISWRTAAVDLFGLFATVGVNMLLVGVTAAAVIVFAKGSWFTDELWRMGRDSVSMSGLLLLVLGLSVVAWGAAWQLSSVASWKAQNVIAAWCWALTVFHLIGCGSVVI